MKLLILLAVAAFGCGKEIGDDCIVSTDCDTGGGLYGTVATNRICELSMPSGYCTIMGCDYNTCPSEAACVRFFSGEFENRLCDPTTEGTSTFDCSLDELCDLQGHCVPRSAEIRYCMRKCSSDGDCRDGYECRDLQKMIDHGGEPVLAPGAIVDDHAPKFCAAKPAA
ncbi:MAG: hypothetical protein ACM31C_31130 [Acidobacteriota bacterium]